MLTWVNQTQLAGVTGESVCIGLITSPTGTTIAAFITNYGGLDVFRATDGGLNGAASWTRVVNSGLACSSLAYGGGGVWFIYGGDFVYGSLDDGVTWAYHIPLLTGSTAGASDGAGTVIFAGANFAAGSVTNDPSSVADFTSTPAWGNVIEGALIWDGTQFVALGDNTSVYTIYTAPTGFPESPGPAWTAAATGGTNSFLAGGQSGGLAYASALGYMAIAQNNLYNPQIVLSATLAGLLTNTPTGLPAPSDTYALRGIFALGPSLFLLGDDNSSTGGNVYESSDGVTWTQDTPNFTVPASEMIGAACHDPVHNCYIMASSGNGTPGGSICTALAGYTVPNVIGETQTAATSAITGAGLILGTVTSGFDSMTAGLVYSQSPAAGTSVSPGSAVDIVLSLGPPDTVPNIIGLTQAAAVAAIVAADLTVGSVTSAFSALPAGLVFSQTPIAGSTVVEGMAVSFIVSLGTMELTVPNVVGQTASQAEATLTNVGLMTGTITGVVSETIPIGSVATQSIAAGTPVTIGTVINLGISFLLPEFNVDATVISQYANSPTIINLVENFGQYFDPNANVQNFYLTVWNIDTAIGFGLDIWGIILGVSRVVPIPGTSNSFGFDNSDSPPDWENFGNQGNPAIGGPFYSGQISGNSYRLNDDAYRTLLLTKALANICATTAQALNALITNLFPGAGTCYTVDRGAMQMSYVFDFPLSTIQFAILAYSGVLPHPAGVAVNIIVVPTSTATFGFNEQGGAAQPFNFGVFYNGG
jgi:beta-lactam-binding protein with PASTA domain